MASDAPTPLSTTSRWIAQPPSAFDIVAAYFPENDSSNTPKLRPCLVLDVLKSEDGDVACRVAYGTKTLKFTQRKNLDLIVQNASDLRAFGLAVATRFDLAKHNILVLPWTDGFFGCWTGYQHPRLGSLNDDYIKNYLYLMAIRQANNLENA